ncbi:MAG TPA: Dabb family protein [Oceanipulchritudo sp.]|nr:Dabb family protein [Oceanipulchritudo sp.]
MIVHLVFFNMLPEAVGSSAKDNANSLVEQLRALPAQIPAIVELEAGLDFSNSPASYEVGLLTKFQSREDLETYRVHPAHQKVVEFVKATTSNRAVVDFEI